MNPLDALTPAAFAIALLALTATLMSKPWRALKVDRSRPASDKSSAVENAAVTEQGTTEVSEQDAKAAETDAEASKRSGAVGAVSPEEEKKPPRRRRRARRSDSPQDADQ